MVRASRVHLFEMFGMRRRVYRAGPAFFMELEGRDSDLSSSSQITGTFAPAELRRLTEKHVWSGDEAQDLEHSAIETGARTGRIKLRGRVCAESK